MRSIMASTSADSFKSQVRMSAWESSSRAAIAALEALAARHMHEWDIREAMEVEGMAERIRAMREHEQPAVKAA